MPYFSEESDGEDEGGLKFSTTVTFTSLCAAQQVARAEGGGGGGSASGAGTSYRFDLAVREYDGPDASCVTGKLFVATPDDSTAAAAAAEAEAPKKKPRLEKEEVQVGLLEGYLIKRPCREFFGVCDSISGELQLISNVFCDSEGRATRVKHPALQNSRAAVNGGGLLQIYLVELRHEHKGADVGLRMVHEALTNLSNMWTLAVVVPCPLGRSFRKFEDPTLGPVVDKMFHTSTPEEDQAHEQATVKVQKHFARLGFLQAGRTPSLSEYFFATKDSYFKGKGDPWNRLLSKDQGGELDLYAKPAVRRLKEVDKELRMLLEFHALGYTSDAVVRLGLVMPGVLRTDRFSRPAGPAPSVLSKIRHLVLEKGASINDSRAVHYVAQKDPAHLELLVELLRLGGDPCLPDEFGNTPLHAAAGSSNVAAIKLLTRSGASTAAVNAEGETPLDRLLASMQYSADFATTFGLGMARADLGPKSEAVQLLLSPGQAASLTGGMITPRMAWYLKTCGEVQYDLLDPEFKDFQRFVPPSVRMLLPRGELSNYHERGMTAVLLACVRILQEKGALCVATARAMALGGPDRYSVQAMLDAGLKVEYVLDFLFCGAEESCRTDDGVVVVDDVEELQEELAAIAPHPLDECFDIAFYMCCCEGGEPLKERGPFREDSHGIRMPDSPESPY